MTLPVSGPISLADVRTEFSTSNPASLGQFYAGGSYLGVNAIGAPASGTISLSNLYGMSDAWFNRYQNGGSTYFQGITISNSNVGYACGVLASSQSMLVSFNGNTGVASWQKGFSESNFVDVAVDTSNNSYCTGSYFGPSIIIGSGVYTPAFLAKYNSAGVVQAQLGVVNPVASANIITNGVAVSTDASGNIYHAIDSAQVGSSSNTSTSERIIGVIKYNSAFSVLWQRILLYPGSSFNQTRPTCLRVDSNSNVYVAGTANTNRTIPSNRVGLIASYDTSGNLRWQKTTTATGQFLRLAVDSSNNLYAIWRDLTSTTASNTLIKFNSSTGDIVWQRSINLFAVDLACDTSGNIFITVGTPGILVYNSSGTLTQYRILQDIIGQPFRPAYTQLTISSANVPYYVTNSDPTIKKNAVNNYLPSAVQLQIPSPNGGLATCLYSPSSHTDSAGSITLANGALTSIAGTFGLSTTTLTDLTLSNVTQKVNNAY